MLVEGGELGLDGTADQRLRFCQPIGGLQQPRQVVQICSHPRMIQAVAGLIDLQGTAHVPGLTNNLHTYPS